jgi:type I restriction enzyme R subunit
MKPGVKCVIALKIICQYRLTTFYLNGIIEQSLKVFDCSCYLIFIPKQVITNLSELRGKLPEAMRDALAHFAGVDRSLEGFEGLEAAQNAINSNEKKDAFALDFKYLAKLWESLSPDNMLTIYSQDYKWLAHVYESVKPASDNIGKLLWLTLGAQTTQLIHENIHVGDVHILEE